MRGLFECSRFVLFRAEILDHPVEGLRAVADPDGVPVYEVSDDVADGADQDGEGGEGDEGPEDEGRLRRVGLSSTRLTQVPGCLDSGVLGFVTYGSKSP